MGWAYNVPDGTPNKGPVIAAVVLAFTTLSLVLVIMRLYVRLLIVKAPGKDDAVIIVAWIGVCVYTITTVLQTKYGLGLTKVTDMPEADVIPFGLWQLVGSPFYVLGIWGFKMSLLFSYMRFFPGTYRIVSYVAATIITMAHIAFALVFIFTCIPVQMQYDRSIKNGHCIKAVPFYLSFSVLTIVFDVGVMLLPFPVLLRSKIQRRKKYALLGLFALGIFVTIIQIIRIQTIEGLTNYVNSSMAILWSVVECDIGIIISCVPTLAPLVRYYNDKSSNRSGHGATSGTAGGRTHDSRYALQTWRSGKSGMHHLSSGVDRRLDDHEITTTGRGKDDDGSSTEIILHQEGITKTTNVTVVTQKRGSHEIGSYHGGSYYLEE